ncbi:MAG: hypothetical protein J7K40_12175 [candidate division Zixibacteria bacterium]|nr:hypothetical protein [candidate division Zixibacteria bacterium]
MTPEEQENIKRLVAMPFRTFLERCIEWKEETGTDFAGVDPTNCPVHQYAMQKGRCLGVTGATELCPVCDSPMCPMCGSHCVEQLSRVTGYLSTVSNWGAAKQQEFKDRQRHKIPGMG